MVATGWGVGPRDGHLLGLMIEVSSYLVNLLVLPNLWDLRSTWRGYNPFVSICYLVIRCNGQPSTDWNGHFWGLFLSVFLKVGIGNLKKK